MTAAILVTFAVVFTLLRVHAHTQKSSTFDEPVHLAAGYAALAYGDHRLDPSHPPFMRMWTAVPLLLIPGVGPDLAPIDRTPPLTWLQQSYGFSHRFLYLENDADRLLYAARFMVVIWGVVLGILVFAWAREWLGLIPAIFALTFYTLEPNLAAHASLVTTDFGVTCFIFGAIYFLWRASRRMTTMNVAGLLTFASLAVVTKFSAFVLGPIIVCLLGIAVGRGATMTFRRACVLVVLIAASTYVGIWAIYGFRYAPGASEAWLFQLQDTSMVNQNAAGAAAVASWADARHLLPNAFTQGFLLSQGSARMLPAFLAGDYSTEGWLQYFPVALAIKTPVALIALLLIGLFFCVTRRQRLGTLNAAFLIVPVIVFLAFAMASHINLGLRHILPIYPFLLLIAAAAVKELASTRIHAARIVVAALTAVWLAEFAGVYPHMLTFFNQLVGGPRNGIRYLADSNIDWGQDLKLLKEWMDGNGVPHVNLAYFGSADPAYYGITCTYLPGAPIFAEQAVGKPDLPGYVAVSATVLSGVYLPRRWRMHYQPLRDETPVARIGNSILVFWVERWPDITRFSTRAAATPLDLDTLRNLADSVFAQRWDTRAARYYRRYLEHRPDDAAALGNFGMSLMSTGRRDEALQAFGRAVELSPNDVRVRRNFVIALLETGRVDEARAHAERVVALAPDDPSARALRHEALTAPAVSAPPPRPAGARTVRAP